MKRSSLIVFDILHLNSLAATYFVQDETYSWQPFGTLSKSKQYWISVWNETKEQKTGKKGYWFKFQIDRQLNSQFSYPDYD